MKTPPPNPGLGFTMCFKGGFGDFIFLFYCFVHATKMKVNLGSAWRQTQEQWDFVAREKSLGRGQENEVTHEFSKKLGGRPHTLIFSFTKNFLLALRILAPRVLTLSLQLFHSFHRQRRQWRPWPAVPMVSVRVPCEFFYFCVLQKMCLGNITVCPVECFFAKIPCICF